MAYDILESNILALKYLNHLTTFQLAKYFLSSSIPFFQGREGWEGNLNILFEFKGFAQSHVLNDVPTLFFDCSLVISYAMFPMLFS